MAVAEAGRNLHEACQSASVGQPRSWFTQVALASTHGMLLLVPIVFISAICERPEVPILAPPREAIDAAMHSNLVYMNLR